ncbi:LacI family DNA-binding transcriptional regulator [Corynebacterium uterequi]|nr:LacI family DNA-binding transcriptional regulator [Corynebacterium uterequi]
MSDVARLAGVSAQTVSRVIHNHPSVREATRQRVLDAMRELDYRPNAAAQMLASGSSQSIGVVTVGPMTHGLTKVFSELQFHARNRGWNVVTASAEKPQASMLKASIDYLRSRQVLAAVFFAQHAELLPVFQTWNHAPGVLLCSAQHQMPSVSTIGIDQVSGLQQALNHLWEQGVEDTVLINGNLTYIDAAERSATYQRYSRLHGKAVSQWGGEGWGAVDGYNAAQRILRQGLPEAILCGNDKIAIGCYRAFAQKDLIAGRDYRLIGFDDDETSAYLTPSLSSVRQDFSLLAETVLAELTALFDGAEHRMFHLDSEFIARESSVLRP